MVTPGPEEQMNAPLFVPQPLPLRLPVVVVVNPVGPLARLKLLMLPLAVNPRSTPLMTLLLVPGAELTVIQSVAVVPVISNLYLAPGHPESPPQSGRVRVAMVSALAGVPKARAKRHKLRPARSFFKLTHPPRVWAPRCASNLSAPRILA